MKQLSLFQIGKTGRRKRSRPNWEAWYARNAEAYRAKRRADYHRNRDANRARMLANQKKNPEYFADSSRNYRAKQRKAFVEHVCGLVVLERDDGECRICGGDVDPTNFHVDHIHALDDGGLHCYANVQLAHPSCNIAKRNR
jgi:5-methylcytosine-specific restriction endonuclease McrA